MVKAERRSSRRAGSDLRRRSDVLWQKESKEEVIKEKRVFARKFPERDISRRSPSPFCVASVFVPYGGCSISAPWTGLPR